VALQVVDERGEGRIHLLGELADALVVVLVCIPAVGADLDERDSGLNQASSEQTSWPKGF